ncbi:CDP-alcohol phosphatidyltransferase [Leifsonia sp. NPDC058248]|uniref:CDP-alcohol phosphatidyltransferase n=1 Tax=Leifsonia sp. NPDC058248 TaxID=3346402 RepID=UPI0036DC01A0
MSESDQDLQAGRREARKGSVRRTTVTIIAVVVLWLALVSPGQYSAWGIQDFLRLPLEALALGVVALFLPRRVMRVVALVFGVLLAAIVLLRGLNLGFRGVLTRPFDIVDDWSYLRDGAESLATIAGPVVAVLAVAAAIAVTVGIFVLVPWASMRVADAVGRQRARAVPVLATLVAGWVILAATGVGWPHGYYTAVLASDATARMAWETAQVAPDDLADRATFAREIHTDPAATVPASSLVAGLAGKDVLLVFVESYGRVALDDPQLAPTVRSTLTTSDKQLSAAGFSARSAWVDSPTFGGGSWLAHSTVEAGLWANNQRRYDQLLAAHRITLSSAFGDAGWRTVFDVPSTDRPWQQGEPFYGYDTLYTKLNVGYHGKQYGYATMPDQFIYHAFAQRELSPGHRKPVYAEIDSLSSHFPWTQPPPLVPWNTIGDGSEFAGPVASTASPRVIYARTVAYAMQSLTQFVTNSHDPNLVVLAMGDHQPNSSVTRPGASHQTPVMLITQDKAALDAAGTWGWNSGLEPASDAPVWPMSAVRDNLFSAFGTSQAHAAVTGAH